ncbi:MAG: DUF362 domain-containing protein, partial [Candidatus Geothermincolia bacterium]
FILDCDYERERMLDSCRAILNHFGIDASGKLVLLKPNMLGPWPPESHVCTHPSLVAGMRLALLERGASVLVGDNPGLAGYGAVERCARVSGIGEAAQDSFINMSGDPRRIEWDSRVTPHTILSATVFRADLVISLPKFKTHLGTTFTGAVKNSFGFVVGAEKARLHACATGRDDFGEVLADVYETRLPDLAVMDAGVVMEGKGPSGGSLRRAGYLLASDDAVALDAACSSMIGLDPRAIAGVRQAADRGLGCIDRAKLELSRPLPVLAGFKVPGKLARSPLGRAAQFMGFRFISRVRLSVDEAACTSCGVCAAQCPTGAIEMREGRPHFDREACVGCYCCYELCSQRAIKPRSLLGQLRPQ